MPSNPQPVVHLELHTPDLARARTFYEALCGWEPERIQANESQYHALMLGRGLGGGMVECPTPRPLWLPYVDVDDVRAALDRARALGARVVLEPREGPSGWRAVLAAPCGAEIALWQAKR